MSDRAQMLATAMQAPRRPTVDTAVEQYFGMKPGMDRLNLLPRHDSKQGWVAPNMVYQLARAMVSPGVAAHGGDVSPEDAVNFAGNVGLGAYGASRIAPVTGPGKTVGMFAGPKARTANVAELERAKALLASGSDDASVWRDTGWWVNTPDGIPRTELPDGINSFQSAYPDSGVTFENNGHGNYNAHTKTVEYNPKDLEHEIQHATQDMEGMSGGAVGGTYQSVTPEQVRAVKMDMTAPDVVEKMAENESLWGSPSLSVRDWKDLAANRPYWLAAGEAEARAVDARKLFPATKRRNTPPWESYDVPLNSLIVRK